MSEPTATRYEHSRNGGVVEVFVAFLKLGLTSFGGPIAHLGYFRRELVEKRRWVSESAYAQLLAISQFLPGPASSQLGFSLGLVRAGWAGALAAFVAFTLPSALLLFGFAAVLPQISGSAALHGLELVALAVVAHGVLGMARNLCPDGPRAAIATAATVVVLLSGPAWVSLIVIGLAGLAGLVWCRGVHAADGDAVAFPHGPRTGWVLLTIFALLLAGLPVGARLADGWVPVTEAFYRAGALVFGGGHVVLPLLEETVVAPGWVSRGDFLAGYGAAQAVPGPMFSFAAYLGARLDGGAGGLAGAGLALAALFLPGLLLMSGVLPFWKSVAARPSAARFVAGVNAAVVGLLGAALYDPIWTTAVRGPADVAIALVGFALLATRRSPALLVVAWCAAASWAAGAWL